MTNFKGTEQEARDLVSILDKNCTCEFDTYTGERVKLCSAHEAMVTDQKFLDGLITYRHLSEKLNKEEFDV